MPIYADTETEARAKLEILIQHIAHSHYAPIQNVRTRIQIIFLEPYRGDPGDHIDENGQSWPWVVFTRKL